MQIKYIDNKEHLVIFYNREGNSARDKINFTAICEKSPAKIMESDVYKWSELAGFAPNAYGFLGVYNTRIQNNLWAYHWQTYASTGD
jgi:hypothetical protein